MKAQCALSIALFICLMLSFTQVRANAIITSVTVSYSVPNVMAMGIYNASGINADGLFSSPTLTFPGGTTFTSAESLGILLQNETNLNSKFDLDGIVSSTDANRIITLMQATTNVASQDFVIKGALFTNAAASTNLRVRTSTNTLTLTGGIGTAPQVDFRLLGGIPGGAAATKNSDTTPSSGGISITSSRRNVDGFARIVLVGDIRENTVNTSTKGNWSGTLTITLTGL